MDYKMIYGENVDTNSAEERLQKLIDTFKSNEKYSPDKIFSSPGRAEVLGNHTDHNHGLVVVASISCDILAVVKKTDGKTVKICSDGYPPILVNVDDTKLRPNEKGTSTALTRGVANALVERGYELGGFTAYLTSNIFKGAGVSSSAAYEVLITEIFNDLYLGGKLTPVEKAVISQYSENVYFGKPCGLLDQSGIAIGSLSKLDFFVPEQPTIEKLGKISGYDFIITNTGGDHASLTPHYAAIRSEMEAVASYFNKSVLRDVPYELFLDNIHALKSKFGGRPILRAMHFYEENNRVISAAEAVKNNDTDKFLQAVNESGLSSLIRLQNCSVPSDLTQPVVLGIELSRQIIKDGAVRVHGGGFAGSILAVVKNSQTPEYVAKMSSVFGKENVFCAEIRPLGTSRI